VVLNPGRAIPVLLDPSGAIPILPDPCGAIPVLLDPGRAIPVAGESVPVFSSLAPLDNNGNEVED
jgi:hypothetical protein